MSSNAFNPRDIPSLAGKTILITGGTAGLGANSVEELAKHDPSHILFSGRKQNKADELIKKVKAASPNVKLTFLRCDISSFASVRDLATAVGQATDRLDILMLNAGIMAVPPGLSPDGYEIQFATNHLGHALLVEKLLPLLQQTAKRPGADVRVINMTSIAYQQAPSNGIDFATLQSDQRKLSALGSMAKWRRYGESKLAQLLYTQELAKHHPDITSVSVHPGIIMTGLFEQVDFATKLPVLLMSIGNRTPVDQGHYNQCWAATCEKSRLTNGEYYEPVGVVGKRTTPQARDAVLAEKLWDWTQKEISASA